MILLALALAAAAPPASAGPDTAAWWRLTAALSNDGMAGRDTGSAAYDRAARLVAARMAAAGAKPLGDAGSFFQRVPLAEVRVEGATAEIGGRPLRFLHEWTLSPAPGMAPSLDLPIAYRGYCAPADLGEVRGKLVICHGTHRAGLPTDAERAAAVRRAGAAAIATIADPGFAVEPPRWPYAYARTVWLEGSAPAPDPLLRLTLNADALGTMVGSGHDAAALVAEGAAGRPLPGFDPPGRFRASFRLAERRYASENVVGYLPGGDPAKAHQAIVLSAHLDGYGPGEPVNGDAIYNGTLDDAAYVALIVRLAERHPSHARPLVLAAFTGEEKGLLGARWFVAHPTLPKADIAADINLDQLRPIFPLDLLTVHALGDTTLGQDARETAAAMGVAVQADPEPERNLLRRADQWPFLQAGIPATAFVFGYRPGTQSERIYRQWYRTGYHKPQDDLAQPIDWRAAGDFNRFFYRLVDRVANAAAPPAWVPGSPLAPK